MPAENDDRIPLTARAPATGPNSARAAWVLEAWIASAGIIIVFGLLKHFGPLIPGVGQHVFTIAAAIQLYTPLVLIGKRGITAKTLGLVAPEWKGWKDLLGWIRAFGPLWKEDLKLFGILAAAVTVPFAIGHHFWMTYLFRHPFNPRVPSDLVEKLLTQIFVVALAEELFYRGYLQERLQKIWPAKRSLFGAPFGAAVIVTSAVFAMVHFVGEYGFDRLGPFFPGLLFGLLRARTGTIVAAILFHAYCNLLGDFLWACYRP